MQNFTPGVTIHRFLTKNGEEAIIRYPEASDVQAMTEYINTISKEDTFIVVSGEQISLEEETKYLEDLMTKMNDGDAVMLLCTVNGTLVGSAAVSRNHSSRRRALHIGIFGISVKAEFRGQGVGYELAKATIDQAKLNIDNLRIITLTVYEPNVKAQLLYEKLGFKEYGVLPGGTWYKDKYIDEISMYLPVVKP